jgi:ribose 5-phosphate isomerase B
MKISVAADEKLAVVDRVLAYLEEKYFQVSWHGPAPGETLPWPTAAQKVAEDIAQGRADEGILLCWTGTGVSIAANKIPGIRAALCVDAETARGARLWNNANVLCLSMRLTSEIIAGEILDTWFNTEYIPNPGDNACLAVLEELDQTYRSN